MSVILFVDGRMVSDGAVSLNSTRFSTTPRNRSNSVDGTQLVPSGSVCSQEDTILLALGFVSAVIVTVRGSSAFWWMTL
ncbi:hypothetical protein M427DRAFT_322829 [Gonapodya prolifera JEL478]|uniref:Uncharacterized protein n=1 Tax=Gonapodya prolifera (strain JEL478) TaxID=1344416 RepID=A0A139AFJ9_GONPJ|nr:hypothetical protein M427DRAFT_322829 [Gonapodya prolifera JEL478]|eukprot:KXS15576.1 hypothetical protein M427DRAFT_322829 [Gonapodya prolifera JEL478]